MVPGASAYLYTDVLQKVLFFMPNDKRKQSLYFPDEMLEEIKQEAARLDRSLSWLVQRAWRLARAEIRALPSDDATADPPRP